MVAVLGSLWYSRLSVVPKCVEMGRTHKSGSLRCVTHCFCTVFLFLFRPFHPTVAIAIIIIVSSGVGDEKADIRADNVRLNIQLRTEKIFGYSRRRKKKRKGRGKREGLVGLYYSVGYFSCMAGGTHARIGGVPCVPGKAYGFYPLHTRHFYVTSDVPILSGEKRKVDVAGSVPVLVCM